MRVLFLILFIGGLAVATAEEGKIDIDALLADDALLDQLLFEDAEVAPSIKTHIKESEEAESDTSLWDWENRFTVGAGYKRNALFNAFSEQSSAFSLVEWESTLIRLGKPRDGQLFAYLVAENRHYTDVEGLDDEWIILALVQAEKPFGNWKLGVTGQSLYLQQAFSLEFDEFDLGTTEIALNQFQLTPKVSYALTKDISANLSLPLSTSRFDNSDQNYNEIGLALDLEMKFRQGGSLALKYGHKDRAYDDRLERAADGETIGGSSLNWQEHQFDLSLDLYLDDPKRWRSKSLLRYRVVEDRGSGYHDFSMAKASQTLSYTNNPSVVSLSGSYTHYDYHVQTKAVGESDLRHRSRLGLGLEVERSFGETWQAFARYDFESYLSNVPEDVYDVHVFTLGMRYTF